MTNSPIELFNNLDLHDCVVKSVQFDWPDSTIVKVKVVAQPGEFIKFPKFVIGEEQEGDKCLIRFRKCLGVQYLTDGTVSSCVHYTYATTDNNLIRQALALRDQGPSAVAGKGQYFEFSFEMLPATLKIVAQDFEVIPLTGDKHIYPGVLRRCLFEFCSIF